MNIYTINLDKRADRLAHITREMEVQGLKWERVPAMEDARDGARGLIKTMMALLYRLQSEGAEIALIQEDDAEYLTSDLMGRIKRCVAQLDEHRPKWDLLMLGANVVSPLEAVEGCPDVRRVTAAYATHSIVYSRRGIEHALALLTSVSRQARMRPLDVLYKEFLQPRSQVYITSQLLAIQRPDFSDIERKQVNYCNFMQDRFKKNNPGLT